MHRYEEQQKEPREERAMEDEVDGLKPSNRPAEFERWNVEDLEAYKTRLKAEIEKIDAVLKGKSSVRDLADQLFKS